MTSLYFELREYMQALPAIATHSHHERDEFFAQDFGLSKLLGKSYAAWCGVPLGNSEQSRKAYFEEVRFRSYFKWLERALQDIYQIDKPLNADTFEEFDSAVRTAHQQDKNFHLTLLKEKCRYEKIVLDSYWAPGENNGHPELFAPTFRMDSLFNAYDPTVKDHDGYNCADLFEGPFDDVDQVTSQLKTLAADRKKRGASAIKCAIAYDRGLDFEFVSKERAQEVFRCKDYRPEDVKAYQDYLFHELCRIAAELNMPLQVHTGLGRLVRSNAYRLQPIIEAHPDTRFVLFHGGYPWMDDILGLVHVYSRNVFPDLCWLPIISNTAAIRMLPELIEVANAHAVCWGCDTWTSEESYGARLAVNHVLAHVLADKVQVGYLTLGEARQIAANFLYHNPKRLYQL